MLYNIFLGYSEILSIGSTIIAVDVAAGVASFFIISLGGVLLGALFAALVSFTTRLAHMTEANP